MCETKVPDDKITGTHRYNNKGYICCVVSQVGLVEVGSVEHSHMVKNKNRVEVGVQLGVPFTIRHTVFSGSRVGMYHNQPINRGEPSFCFAFLHYDVFPCSGTLKRGD